ncbi:MAG TPA: hypothetical protein PLI59_21555, partial [Candidatus Obscuribacter sp.]|nr:hypothetical protein [Candidatus Obscuribacter sp.]
LSGKSPAGEITATASEKNAVITRKGKILRQFPTAPFSLEAAAPGGACSGDGKEAGKDLS